MGTMITLGIGCMEIDWGKNSTYTDHSVLFTPSDVKPIPYYYVNSDSNELYTEMKEGYSRKLSKIKRRLDLLGYSLARIKDMYIEHVKEHEEYGYEIKVSFELFYDIIKSLYIPNFNTAKSSVEYVENGYDFGEYVKKCILTDIQIKEKIISAYGSNNEYERLESDLAYFMESINPYITLRILSENPNNNDYDVYWSFADVVENEWVKRETIVKELEEDKKILIVTEGSSDSYILQRTINCLYPDIADFFHFVDMKDNYPFTGVGNLYNFCMGLCRIKIKNNVIVIFDNDTAGVEKYKKSLLLEKRNTFLITKLPDYSEFSNINTIGPQGETIEDINGRAVAIECFLDFGSIEEQPCVRWSMYNKNEKQYQGELICKDDYVKAFEKSNITDGSYDTRKLRYLIDYLINEWLKLN